MTNDLMSTLPKSMANPKGRMLASLMIMVVPLLIVFGLGLALIQVNQKQVASGPAPDFTFKLFDSQAFALSAQHGKVVLINFWASWCGPCRAEAPDLNGIWDEYKDRGVVMVGVDYLDNESDARRFLKEFDVQYLNGPDIETEIARAYRIKGVPETYVVDKQGNLAMTIPALTTAKALRQILDTLLTP